MVGAGVYGGIVKREAVTGKILPGDECPENNLSPPAHNPVHSTGPYLDWSKLTRENRGYSHIANLIQEGDASKVEALLKSAGDEADRRKLANLVMTGGARPLHMCGMGRGGDTTAIIKVCCGPSPTSARPADHRTACSGGRPSQPPLHVGRCSSRPAPTSTPRTTTR